MRMGYFNFHAAVKKLIKDGKLVKFEFVDNYRGISPALVLYFNDPKRPVVPIREYRWEEYFPFIQDKPTR